MAAAEILIIGGGIIGLAIALELKCQGASVTILCRDSFATRGRDRAEAATYAAAGMLAPQAEKILPSPMLDLCAASLALYPDWIHKLESLTGLDPGYWPCGILAPTFNQPQTHTDSWLDRASIQAHQPGLSDRVVGGWWFPNDGQVDNRALIKALWAAVRELGVEIHTGVTVNRFECDNARIQRLHTTEGEWQADRYILATGAWSQALLPIPVFPRKGQMLSVKIPANADLPLKQVLYGDETYIVPRRDGRIVIGATSEDVGFVSGNTAIGINTLLSAAIELYPAIADFELQEVWFGFRPATPDELPILGASLYENLILATGHYRNGILLAPITGKAIAQFLRDSQTAALEAFSWSRFKSVH